MHAHKKKYITKALNILICFIALPLKAVFTACLVHILCFIMFMCNNDVYAIWSFSQHEGIPKSFSLLWSDIREDFTPSLKKKKKKLLPLICFNLSIICTLPTICSLQIKRSSTNIRDILWGGWGDYRQLHSQDCLLPQSLAWPPRQNF